MKSHHYKFQTIISGDLIVPYSQTFTLIIRDSTFYIANSSADLSSESFIAITPSASYNLNKWRTIIDIDAFDPTLAGVQYKSALTTLQLIRPNTMNINCRVKLHVHIGGHTLGCARIEIM